MTEWHPKREIFMQIWYHLVMINLVKGIPYGGDFTNTFSKPFGTIRVIILKIECHIWSEENKFLKKSLAQFSILPKNMSALIPPERVANDFHSHLGMILIYRCKRFSFPFNNHSQQVSYYKSHKIAIDGHYNYITIPLPKCNPSNSRANCTTIQL